VKLYFKYWFESQIYFNEIWNLFSLFLNHWKSFCKIINILSDFMNHKKCPILRFPFVRLSICWIAIRCRVGLESKVRQKCKSFLFDIKKFYKNTIKLFFNLELIKVVVILFLMTFGFGLSLDSWEKNLKMTFS
jgi:hypothetical protein